MQGSDIGDLESRSSWQMAHNGPVPVGAEEVETAVEFEAAGVGGAGVGAAGADAAPDATGADVTDVVNVALNNGLVGADCIGGC